MPAGTPDKWGFRPEAHDELLGEFSEVPTVLSTESAADPHETRRALLSLVSQGLDAEAGTDDIAEAVAAVMPGNWSGPRAPGRAY